MTPDLSPEAADQLRTALRRLDAAHAAGRDRLLAALPSHPVPVPSSVWRKGTDVLRRHWRGGVLTAAVAAGLVAGLLAVRPPGALAATAAAIREAGSFRARLSLVDFPAGVDADGTDAGTISWAPEGMRSVEPMGGPAPQVTIELVGKPGIEIRPQNNTYRWLDPEREANPFFKLVGGLADARGRGAVPLGKKQIGDATVVGYELPLRRLLAEWEDVDGAMQVWFDPASKRPVRLIVTGAGAPPGKALRLDRFEWGLPTAGWFDLTPPDGFTEYKSSGRTDDEMTALIVVGLRCYADKTGHYPKVRYIYGDQMGDELARLMGRQDRHDGGFRLPADRPFNPDDPRELFGAATCGFGCINGIQRRNPDAVYNGKTVGPADGGKVLFRWRLADGRYRVIFGDLEVLTVTADRLKQLER